MSVARRLLHDVPAAKYVFTQAFYLGQDVTQSETTEREN